MLLLADSLLTLQYSYSRLKYVIHYLMQYLCSEKCNAQDVIEANLI